MCIQHVQLSWTVMLLLLPGVCSQWRVEYEQQQICALKGSSVLVPCSFYYPSRMKVQSVKWGHGDHIYLGPFMYDSESNNTSPRYQYVGDALHNCSLKIQEVEQSDAGKHAFRFTAGRAGGPVDGYTGSAGSRLEVADLTITVEGTDGDETPKEGDAVKLTCSNQCDVNGLSSFTWWKDGQLVHEGPVLHLSNISYTDSGNYSCSPNAQRRPTSEVIAIDVEYGPKNIWVSVRPSTDVDAGGSFGLVCSSTAKPAVEDYTWFKRGDSEVIVGNGPELNVVDVHLQDGGQYICRVTNKHGRLNSSVVTIKVKAYWPTFTRDALIIAAVATLTVTVTILFITRRCCKRKTRAPRIIRETERVEDAENAIYLPVFANVQSEAEGSTTEIVYAALDFNQKKSNMQQQADIEEDEDDDGVIYSTVLKKPAYMKQK
ncbi:sialoadhesin-like [Betta splendens]|uniref:Sialoadhesin-like n=1 Tax=Betta splendens TaxID=158456 RepID=A0A9W2XYD1_BETSP|nr:sialoadhesin-like [Betta splendens]